MRRAIEERPNSKDDQDPHLVFITQHRQRWAKNTSTNPVSAEFRKLVQSLGIYRKGCGFYALRHTFRTIADETCDFPAIDLIMGHPEESMAARYREWISDDRLRQVTDHVRRWRFNRG